MEGGLGLASSWEAEFGARSPNKRKNLGSSGTTRGKIGTESREYTALNCEFTEIYQANFGVISEIQRVKFGILVTYIFGGKIWGSDTNFREEF